MLPLRTGVTLSELQRYVAEIRLVVLHRDGIEHHATDGESRLR
ncbi:hypothetical protein [Saccharopolyspora pogona]|nr:hypothetical protein [Saccharopolyspora pogona]